MKVLQPSFLKYLQPCMKAQQSCASWWSHGLKDSRVQWSELSGHHWVSTVYFTHSVTKMLSSVRMTCLCLSCSNTGNAVICILQKSCSDSSCNFWLVRRCALVLSGSLGYGMKYLAYMTVHQSVARESADWTSDHRLSWLCFQASH